MCYPGKKNTHRTLIQTVLCLILLAVAPLQAQDIETFRRNLEKLQKDPLFQQFFPTEDKSGLSPEQKHLLLETVDSMTDAEIERSLKRMGLPLTGSVYQKRERLKQALGLIAPPKLPAARTIPKISIEHASEGEFIQGDEQSRGLLVLRGRIRVRLSGGVLHANTVIVDTTRQELYAEGNITYKNKDSLIHAERLLFDQRLQQGVLYNGTGYKKPLFFIGQKIHQFGAKQYSISHAHFTGSAAKRPHYSFSARKLWVYEGEKIVAVGIVYYVGGIPLLPLPFLYASDWGTGVITQAGHSDVQGFFLQNTYQFSVPTALGSLWQPVYYRFTLDYYENTGETLGAQFTKFSPNLNYIVQLGAAGFRRYEIISDFREKNSLRITNQVRHSDATIGREYYKWQKAFSVVNAKSVDRENDGVRNLYIRFEDYTHRLYEFEFGSRYTPVSTIPALYENSESGRGLIRNDLDWNLLYTESRGDLRLRLQATRKRIWQESSDFAASHYQASRDVVPTLDVSKNMKMGRIPVVDMPVYWNNKLHMDLVKTYSDGDISRSVNTNRFTSELKTSTEFYPYVSFAPSLGAGAQDVTPQNEPVDASVALTLDRDSKKRSYQFLFSESKLTFGPGSLFFRATYRRKDSYREELDDAPELNILGFTNNQKVNETELRLEANPLDRMSFSVTTIYDHRKFEYLVGNSERWYYPVFRSDVYLDFLNGLGPERENLLTRRKAHFMGLRVTNDYVYNMIRKQDHSNVLGLSFQMGGYRLLFLEHLRFLELGFHWYHAYYEQSRDLVRFSAKLDLRLTRYVYFEMELESRAVDVTRYERDPWWAGVADQSDYVPFYQDIFNGSGLAGRQRREDAVFNTGFFQGVIVLDLEDWEMRFGYELEQRSIFAGVNSVDVVHYYDNRLFFSMTLLRFDVSGVSDRPSRFLIHRQRVRPTDIGRSSISSQ